MGRFLACIAWSALLPATCIATTGTRSSYERSTPLEGVAAWWGQSGGDLADVCNDPSYSIVVLSFVNNFFANASMPGMNLAGAVNDASPEQKKAGAVDLLDGSPLLPALHKCRSSGKKVFISLGGQAASENLTDDTEGALLANNIWNIFLGGQQSNLSAIRPFGDVILDGVDMDIETANRTGWLGFAKQMRSNFREDFNREYYISAAPQCMRNHYDSEGKKLPLGDLSLSDEVLQQTDISWVQFYNNPGCNHGDPGFYSAVADWAKAIYPSQMWIATPGGPTKMSATNGYADIPTMKKEISVISKMQIPNLGGWAIWDAITARNNSDYQKAVAATLHPRSSLWPRLAPLLIFPAIWLLLAIAFLAYWVGRRHTSSLQSSLKRLSALGPRFCTTCSTSFHSEADYFRLVSQELRLGQTSY